MDVTLDEVRRRLGDGDFVLVDVRSAAEYRGELTAHCDPRAGRIPGAVNFDVQELLGATPEDVRERLGAPEEVELVTYCHAGSRSELAAQILGSLGYRASNYRGSWHEWSRDDSLPVESGEFSNS
jgi:thiosulfate/3-mercaptopyruvate sulfurtransferase